MIPIGKELPSTDLQSYQFLELQAASGQAGDNQLKIRLAAATGADSSLGQPGQEAGDLFLQSDPAGDGQTLVVSLGKAGKIDAESLRKTGGLVAKWLVKHKVAHASLDVSSLDEYGGLDGVRALGEGLLLGAFRFEEFKSIDKQPTRPVLTLTTSSELAALEQVIREVTVISAATNLARNWSHQPGNVIRPVSLANWIEALALDHGLPVQILDEQQLAEMGAGGIINVGQGSDDPPRLIVIEHPGTTASEQPPVILVGKAITFDTGGYSIKDVTGIQGMKYDKTGGVVVTAAVLAAHLLDLPVRVVGIIGAAENMISGGAYRPDDIVRTLSGKTVEIVTTDAEGRLVLADALTYAQRNYQPQALIDVATLTGGIVVALGHIRGGIWANDDSLAVQLLAAGEDTYERIWRMPLDDEYVQLIQGHDADLRNSGGREGHPIFGGVFLHQFIEGSLPWAHLDIAGMADVAKDTPYCPRGGTGFGVRLLMRYLQNLSINQ